MVLYSQAKQKMIFSVSTNVGTGISVLYLSGLKARTATFLYHSRLEMGALETYLLFHLASSVSEGSRSTNNASLKQS